MARTFTEKTTDYQQAIPQIGIRNKERHTAVEKDVSVDGGRYALEADKPFRLVKYISVSSFVVLLISTVLLSSFITHRARQVLVKKSEQFADLIVENLNDQVFYQFTVPTFLRDGEIRLSRKDQYERLDKVVRNTIHGFAVDKVNIYNPQGILTYSTEEKKLGTKGNLGEPFYRALKGESTSILKDYGESLLGFNWKTGPRKLITYLPMWVVKPVSWKRGTILGVFEITQDVSEDYETIHRFQLIVLAAFVVFSGVLFATLLFLARRAEKIISTRAKERKKLEEQLHQAERLAALGEMISGISHEIRNPLGIIRSTAELMHNRVEGERQRKLAEIIVEEASRLNNILTEFLDFARPKTLQTKPCKVEDIIKRNLTVLQSELEKRSIIVETSFQTGDTSMEADPDLLYRAMVNLFHNAIQAMPKGGTLSIQTRLTMQNNLSEPQVEIMIRDTGVGIPPELQRKIFNPFFTTREKGTGLGLAIVQSIVNGHSGTIDVESDMGKGTTITIRLPVVQNAKPTGKEKTA